jgi:hypothetical protein
MATIIPSFKKDNPFEPINDNELIGLTFNDQGGPAPDILWSSAKIKSLIQPYPPSGIQEKQLSAGPNLAKFGEGANLGQTIDSGLSLDDNAGPSANIIWSSEKIANIPLPPFQLKQQEAVGGDIAVFGFDVNVGQVIDSGFGINDSSMASPNILWSSNQIQNHILSVTQAKQAKQPSAVSGNFASFGDGSDNGQVIDSGFLINDSAVPSSNVLYSSAKIQQLLPPPSQQVSFLSDALPPPVSAPPPSLGVLYVGVDGSSYVWNGSTYNGVLVKAYSKFITQSPLQLLPGSNLSMPFPIIESSGTSSSGSISIAPNGAVSIISSSKAPTLYKASFSGQGLNGGVASLRASFSFFDNASNALIGNSSSAFSFSNGGMFGWSSQCSLEHYFVVPPLGQTAFSVKVSTKATDPPAVLGNNGALDNPYLIVEQVY